VSRLLVELQSQIAELRAEVTTLHGADKKRALVQIAARERIIEQRLYHDAREPKQQAKRLTAHPYWRYSGRVR
jgi:hypothetical protein